MKPVKSPWSLFGIVALSLGGAFFVTSVIICIAIGFRLSPIVNVFAINGASWIVLGAISCAFDKAGSVKANRLKKGGVRYDAEIVRLKINPAVRAGGYITVCAECAYRNLNDESCLVKSRLFLLNVPKESLKAEVFVNKTDPRDYFVEVSYEKETAVRYDHDYR